MENALFLNNKSNFSSYTCIDNKRSDQWVKNKLRDLYSSNSFHVCEIKSKNSKSDLIKNDKNTLPERGNNNESCGNSNEPCCHVKLNTFLRLKDSTKQLLCLLEEIQAKVHTKNIIPDETPNFNNVFQCDLQSKEINSVTNVIDLKRLESHTRKLDTIYITDEHDDCSVYKRLIRKCHCLNHPDYNDFVIHFNEESKFTTSSIGELIKNMRILRKFLYMGGTYTKNALMFLYEGLLESQRYEKLEIIQGCAHADICNVFDEHSIVTTCISWPCKYKYYGNYVTQNLAAGFLYKLADIEEGRRYLNYSSKIANDIRKILRKKSSCLEIDIVDSLNATLNLLKPNFAKNPVTCFTKSVYEGIGPRLIKDLFHNRQFMNFDEIYMYLDLLNSYSNCENESEIILHLPALLILFKQLLMEYDNSELNIIVTSILNNIVSKNIVKNDRQQMETNLAFADTSTEVYYYNLKRSLLKCFCLNFNHSSKAIKMKNEMCQKPSKKNYCKKITKPNKFCVSISQNKQRQPSKQKDLSMSLVNRSRKFSKDLRKSIIIVPIEEN